MESRRYRDYIDVATGHSYIHMDQQVYEALVLIALTTLEGVSRILDKSA